MTKESLVLNLKQSLMLQPVLNTEVKTAVVLRLRRIADVLLLNGSLTGNLGLLRGKIGIAIFMYIYARKTGNETYKKFAGELIDEIYEQINISTPVDFENGLTGIGWGIEYLVKNRFVEADTDEALSEIDNAIYKAMMQRPVLTTDGSDLFGYGFYYLARLRGRENDDENLNTLIKKQVLIYLTDECERLLILKRYLDFNIKALGIGMINSLIWFLAEMHGLGLFPSKVDKLLRHLPSELEFTVKAESDPADQYVLYQLIQSIIPLVNDNEIKKRYKSFAEMMIARWKELNADDEKSADMFSSLAWHKLIFGPYVGKDNELLPFSEKVFSIIDNEENWSARLDRLNKENIGLNGLAGLGLGLLAGGTGHSARGSGLKRSSRIM
jgi:hypothetical protein